MEIRADRTARGKGREMAASERMLEIGGCKVPVLSAGKGPALLVIHRDSEPTGWTPFLERLSQKFTVYLPTLPGYAAAGMPAWARHPRDLGGLAQWIIKDLKLDQPAVVGLGFGGWIAAEMITLAPGAFRSLV